jgi:hypothetical protein
LPFGSVFKNGNIFKIDFLKREEDKRLAGYTGKVIEVEAKLYNKRECRKMRI